MTCLSQNCTANCRISHPVGSRDPRRVDTAVEHRRRGPFFELLLQTEITRCVTPIEAVRELRARFLNRLADTAALVFGEGHGLFDKYMLPRLQCRQSLRGVMLIPAYDHDDVHRRIIENLVVVRSAIFRAKSNRVAFGAGAAARLNGAEPHTWNLLQIRQMDPASQISSAHQRNPEVCTAALDWVYRDSRCRLGLGRI